MNKIQPKKKFKWTDEGPFEFLRIMASILTALVVTFIVLCFVTKSFALDVFINLLTYPSRSMFYFGYVLVKMVPLCFAGLATLLYFRTGLFNLSTEGVFYISGVVATWFAINPNIMTGNEIIDTTICLLAAGVSGSLIALIPGFLKAKLNADEMVISLMLNSILFGIGYYIVINLLSLFCKSFDFCYKIRYVFFKLLMVEYHRNKER